MALPGFIGSHGLIGGAWHKNPILLGYSDRVFFGKTDTVSGTAQIVSMDAVPAGEIHIVTAISGRNNTSPITIGVSLGVWFMSFLAVANRTPPTETNEFFGVACYIVLKEGDYVQGQFKGCTDGDIINLKYAGIRVDIDL